MNVQALNTFLTVIELGNLNKAAERLNVTQSTVSARLDALEESLGQVLLVRSRRGAQMTKAGFALQRHAEVIVETWERARRAVEVPAGFKATFSLSCEHDLWEGQAETWTRQVADRHPELAIEIWPGAVAEIHTWMRSGLIDAAITRDPIAEDGISTRLLKAEEIIFVRSKRASPDVMEIAVDHGPDFRRRLVDESVVSALTFGAGGSRWALDHILRETAAGYLARGLVAPLLESGELVHVTTKPVYEAKRHFCWRTASAERHPWLEDTF